MTPDAWTATTRFGLGARPGELVEAAGDPRGWLLAQLAVPGATPAALRALPDAASSIQRFLAARTGGPDAKKAVRQAMRADYVAEVRARLRLSASTTQPFFERWVAFWTDHFTVSVLKAPLLGLAGAYEREAIRPRVLGSFPELLLAAVRHPAMLHYLDNHGSIGPRSRRGRRWGRGLNENLAREILELHTLGVNGGYGQADVLALARMLTGWTVAGPRRGGTGRFVFEPRTHEPGPKTLLGQRYAEAGEDEGVSALRALATHPSTARHVAGELARHFVADQPPRAAVDALAKVFVRSEGDLAELAKAVVGLGPAWARAGGKVKTPWELVVSAARALRLDSGPRPLVGALRHLGQPPWAASSPAGWADEAAGWLGPEALMRRIEWAEGAARRWGRGVEALPLADAVLGPRLRPATRSAVRAAEPTRALAIVLASPEFQRR